MTAIDRVDAEDIKAAVSIASHVAKFTGGLKKQGAELIGLCPFHADANPSLRVNPSKNGGVWRCDVCDIGGDVLAFEQRRLGSNFPTAIASLVDTYRGGDASARRRAHPPPQMQGASAHVPDAHTQARVVARYRYLDANGALLASKERLEPGQHGRSKSFRWRMRDGAVGKDPNVTLYNLPAVLAAVAAHEPILITEGEKCTDALTALGFTATTCADGAGKWTAGDTEALVGARAVVLADNDEPGRRHASAVVAALTGKASSVTTLELPDLPPKGDVVDWLASGGTKDALRALIDRALRGDDGLVRIADVEREHVEWLWHARLPLGKLAVLDGDPGLGKSTLTLDIAARVTTGRPMPDAAGLDAPASVLFLTAEDGLGDTIRPRLEAAGADLERVFALQHICDASGAKRPPSIPGDLERVERVALDQRVRLIVIDPLMAFLGGGVDSFKDHDIRRALHPVADLATRTGASVLLVRHLNKGASGNALYRGGGSIGIIGACRSGLLVARDPEDPNRRVLASTKCNLAAEPASLAFSTETTGDVARIAWHGESAHRASHLVAAPTNEEERSALDEAVDLLRRLTDEGGGQVIVSEARKVAAAAGIEPKTLQRARGRLGMKPVRGAFGGPYAWSLPAGHAGHAGQPLPSACPPVHQGDLVHQGFPCGETDVRAEQPPLLDTLDSPPLDSAEPEGR